MLHLIHEVHVCGHSTSIFENLILVNRIHNNSSNETTKSTLTLWVLVDVLHITQICIICLTRICRCRTRTWNITVLVACFWYFLLCWPLMHNTHDAHMRWKTQQLAMFVQWDHVHFRGLIRYVYDFYRSMDGITFYFILLKITSSEWCCATHIWSVLNVKTKWTQQKKSKTKMNKQCQPIKRITFRFLKSCSTFFCIVY